MAGWPRPPPTPRGGDVLHHLLQRGVSASEEIMARGVDDDDDDDSAS